MSRRSSRSAASYASPTGPLCRNWQARPLQLRSSARGLLRSLVGRVQLLLILLLLLLHLLQLLHQLLGSLHDIGIVRRSERCGVVLVYLLLLLLLERLPTRSSTRPAECARRCRLLLRPRIL